MKIESEGKKERLQVKRLSTYWSTVGEDGVPTIIPESRRLAYTYTERELD